MLTYQYQLPFPIKPEPIIKTTPLTGYPKEGYGQKVGLSPRMKKLFQKWFPRQFPHKPAQGNNPNLPMAAQNLPQVVNDKPTTRHVKR